MKVIYHILLVFVALTLWCCQDDSASLNQVGYLRLSVAGSGQLNTRAYDPKIMHVEILSEDSAIVKQTDDLDEWEGEVFELPVGAYRIIAYSNDYKGQPAFNSPYYYGDTTVQVKEATETKAKVDCKIANVKVTVNYSEDFKTAFAGRDIFVTVGSAEEKPSFSSMTFKYGSDAALYLPSDCGPLKATLNVSKSDGSEEYYTLSETKRLAEPKANDHFILNYQMGDTNKGDFTVTVDPTTNSYSYTFYINMTPLKVSAKYGTVNAWATFAYLEASNVEADGEVNPTTVKFNYRKKGEQEWQEIATVESEGTYTACPTNLEDSTTYEYCLAVNGIQANMGPLFTTEEAVVLQNGGFEDWYLLEAKLGFMGSDSKTWYPCSSDYYSNNGTSYWDSSNPGTTQGMGSMSGGLNPTQGTTEVIHSGTHAAQLETQWAVLKLAAASIYTGKFNSLVGASGAKIDFGQPFTSRPISLKGWYQYKPEIIDDEKKEVGNSGALKNGDTDQCSIYIILAKGTHQVDNTNTKTLLTAENVKADDNFIAYGELPADQCVSTDGEWKEFNIPLEYKEDQFGEKPTHLIIVCSSSKYGDYFTGAIGSTLYLDDFSLIYDGEPTIWE